MMAIVARPIACQTKLRSIPSCAPSSGKTQHTDQDHQAIRLKPRQWGSERLGHQSYCDTSTIKRRQRHQVEDGKQNVGDPVARWDLEGT
jgi:hypothetical protein